MGMSGKLTESVFLGRVKEEVERFIPYWIGAVVHMTGALARV